MHMCCHSYRYFSLSLFAHHAHVLLFVFFSFIHLIFIYTDDSSYVLRSFDFPSFFSRFNSSYEMRTEIIFFSFFFSFYYPHINLTLVSCLKQSVSMHVRVRHTRTTIRKMTLNRSKMVLLSLILFYFCVLFSLISLFRFLFIFIKLFLHVNVIV